MGTPDLDEEQASHDANLPTPEAFRAGLRALASEKPALSGIVVKGSGSAGKNKNAPKGGVIPS